MAGAGNSAKSWKSGQAAAEYIATYGWALLAVFIVLTVILASGIFNASHFASEECTLQPNIACSGYYMTKTKANEIEVGMTITNMLGYPIYLHNYSMVYDSARYNCDDFATCGANAYIAAGEKLAIKKTIGPVEPPASPKKIGLEIGFRNCQDFNSTPAGQQACGTASDDAYPLHTTWGRLFLNLR